MIKILRCILLFVLLLCSNTNLTSARQIDDRSKAQELLTRILREDNGVGIMAAVYRDGKLIWSGSAGFADLEGRLKMENGHRLRIGSVSKPITAILALKLAEINKLDLDRSIGRILPERKEDLIGITPRLLGSHLAGIRQYDFSNFIEANNTRYFPTLKESFHIYKEDLIVAEPKAEFLYTSIGFNMLGAAIENSTQTTFSQVLSEKIAAPLDLKNTMTDNSVEVIEDRGRFYTIGNPNPVFAWMKEGQIINTFFRDGSDYYPSGGLLSNAEDLAKFADKVFNSAFLSERSKEIIESPARTSDGKEAGYTNGGERAVYTYGWEIRYEKDGSVRSFGHNGETNGAYALIRYFPEQKLSVAAIVNYNIVAAEPAFFELAGDKLPEIFLTKIR